VGFTRNLPRDLFAAFRATFEEAADADLLLHVVDAADDARDERVRTTEALLDELELSEIPRLVVYNKVDLLDPPARRTLERQHPDAVCLSALERDSTRGLVARVAELLAARWEEAAKGPALVPDGAPAATEQDDEGASDPGELTTIEELLAARRRR